jgi:hypothetical protein
MLLRLLLRSRHPTFGTCLRHLAAVFSCRPCLYTRSMDETTVKTIPEALIPSTFDDLPLTLFEFRLAAHIMRRCGKDGECYESDANMARFIQEKCETKTARETVNRARRFLVAIRLFDTVATPGETVRYTRRPHGQWASAEEISHLRYLGASAVSQRVTEITGGVILESRESDRDITGDVISESQGSDQGVTGDVISESQGGDQGVTGDVIRESHKGVPLNGVTSEVNAVEGSGDGGFINFENLDSFDSLTRLSIQARQDPLTRERYEKAAGVLSLKKAITIEQFNLYHVINSCSAKMSNVQYSGLELDLGQGLPRTFGKSLKIFQQNVACLLRLNMISGVVEGNIGKYTATDVSEWKTNPG